jgi:hypothetical protein
MHILDVKICFSPIKQTYVICIGLSWRLPICLALWYGKMYWITNILDGIGWRGLLCLASLHGLHLQICPNSTNVVVTPSDKQVWMNEVYNIIYIYICVCVFPSWLALYFLSTFLQSLPWGFLVYLHWDGVSRGKPCICRRIWLTSLLMLGVGDQRLGIFCYRGP